MRGLRRVSVLALAPQWSTGEKGMDLHDVRIRIPLGTSEAPGILSVDGSHKYNAHNNELIWDLQLIDQSNPSGSLEFSISQKDADAFFPISVEFSSQSLFWHPNFHS